MNNAATLGWDLGGAHVKAVLIDAAGVAVYAAQRPCPLWRGLDHLERAVSGMLAELPIRPVRHAVTMTGELADIFSSREDGVRQIGDAMVRQLGVEHLRIYAGAQGFVTPAELARHFARIASANWHASARFLTGKVDQALLLDVGSTTSDLIVLHAGTVASCGDSDAARMTYDELLYTGVVRTPVMAVSPRVPFDGVWQGVAAEHFATMADVYRLTGDLPEACDMAETADGADKTPEASARRLARMVGRDLADAGMARWRALARAIRAQQLHQLQNGVERVLSRGLLGEQAPLIGAGAGSFLVQRLARQMGRDYRDVSEWVSALPEVQPWAMVCLPAYAVAQLLEQAQS